MLKAQVLAYCWALSGNIDNIDNSDLLIIDYW